MLKIDAHNWYARPIPRHAPAGGAELFGKFYAGGEFEPFYIPRAIMPQIDERDLPEFMAFLATKAARPFTTFLHPEDVTPHQRVEPVHLVSMPPETMNKPILVSEDNFILDGHHRWALYRSAGTSLRAIVIPREFWGAIPLMFEFPKTYILADIGDTIRN